MSVALPFEIVRVPPHIVNFKHPLPWDVYDSNGLLYAKKGTIIGELVGFFDPPKLFFDQKFHPSNAEIVGVEFNFPTPTPGIIAGVDDASNPMYKFTCDKSAALSDQVDSVIRHTNRLLINYTASPAWAHSVYQHAQAILFLTNLNMPAFFMALYVHRAFSDMQYPAAQAVMRAILSVIAAKDTKTYNHNEILSLICAGLTCDLSIYAQLAAQAKSKTAVLLNGQDKAFLKDHGKRSYEMLKAASVENAQWLFIARRHERPISLNTGQELSEESAKLYVLNDFVYFSDIAAARCAFRKDRPALPLFNSIANVSFDANKSPVFAGCKLAKILGTPPLGSLISTKEGLVLMFGPTSGVYITNEAYELKANYRIVKTINLKPGDYTVVSPNSCSKMSGLIIRLVDSFGKSANFN